MFETATALALDHFAREAVAVAVLEVGLGGRLDATTVGVPAVTVVTRIDLDHQAVLGTTLHEIAAEKAAIIRAGVAVAASQAPEATAVLVRRATEVGVPLLLSGRDLSVTVEHRGLDGQLIGCAAPGWSIARLRLGMLGSYQPENALLAVAAARQLGVGDAAIGDGLGRARWPGRSPWRPVRRRPRSFASPAHSPSSATSSGTSPGAIRLALSKRGLIA